MTITTGWAAAQPSKPDLEDVIAAIEDRITAESDGKIYFRCVLHDDFNASGVLSYGYDSLDPRRYSIRCYGCDGDETEWFGDFLRFMNGEDVEDSWSSKSSGQTFIAERHEVSRKVLARYSYVDDSGRPIATKIRYQVKLLDPENPQGPWIYAKAFSWDMQQSVTGHKAPLYRLDDVAWARKHEMPIYFVEGEKDADTMHNLGHCATTSPNGARADLTEAHVASLTGIDVVIIADNDSAGRAHARHVYERIQPVATSVKLLVPRLLKDVTEIYEAGLDLFGELEPLELIEEDLVSHKYRPHLNPLAMNFDDVKPKYFLDLHGRPMFYPGLTHAIVGPPGTFKSWLLLKVALNCNARYWDFENGLAALATRLRMLGASAERTGFFDTPRSKDEVRERIAEYVESNIEMLCIDGFAGIAGIFGVDINDNSAVNGLLQETVKPLKDAGIALAYLDHTPKTGRDEYGIGAQVKKADADVMMVIRPSDGTSAMEFFVRKDRHHQLTSRCTGTAPKEYYGHLEISATRTSFDIAIRGSVVAYVDGVFTPSQTAVDRLRTWEIVQRMPGCSYAALEAELGGNKAAGRANRKWLVEHGNLTATDLGSGRGFALTVAKPYEIDWRTAEADDLECQIDPQDFLRST